MKKDLKFVTCCPDDTYYTWQVHLWIESLKNLGHSKDALVLIFVPYSRKKNMGWEKIIALYPEATFKFYTDTNNEITTSLIPIYIPILRPWLMKNWFKDNPSYSEKAIFYCDSDILFTKDFDVSAFVDDDINYLSDTNSYVGADYFINKVNDAIESKKEDFVRYDVLTNMGSLLGITKDTIIKNKDNSGGAQYLLKNLNVEYWEKVQKDSIIVRKKLQEVNRMFFENESKGFQSWCADMWAVLWGLWYKGGETKNISEMDFAWSTDNIDTLKTRPILHNAGVVSDNMNGVPYFYKGKYHGGGDPTEDKLFEIILNHEETKKKCNWYYAKALKDLKDKYNIKY